MEEDKKFYRYEAEDQVSYGRDMDGEIVKGLSIPTMKLVLLELNLHKETPKGWWVGYGHFYPGYKLRSHSRWISKDGRKRYAYPTKQEALHSFIKRKEKEIKILKYRLDASQDALILAKRAIDGCKTCINNKPGLEAGLFCINNCVAGSKYQKAEDVL